MNHESEMCLNLAHTTKTTVIVLQTTWCIAVAYLQLTERDYLENTLSKMGWVAVVCLPVAVVCSCWAADSWYRVQL